VDAPNLARLDLVSLRLVLLCTELGSLSLAAEASNLSLSGASGRVARIEQAYRRKLFIRHARGLAPTGDGVIVAQHARRVLDVLGEMTQSLASAGSGNGRGEEPRRALACHARNLA
jgi:DNA-binding transcriptional LysR family regulator